MLQSGFHTPPRARRQDGALRRAGFELELAGLGVRDVAEVVRRLFGGEIDERSAFVAAVQETRFGDFEVCIDSKLLSSQRYLDLLHELGLELDGRALQTLESLIGQVAGLIVPTEIVTPPLPIDQIGELERLRRALRLADAEGTRASLRYAFGLHINIEVPDLSAKTLTSTLKAFVLLYERIVHAGEIDISRRLTPYIEPFGDDYTKLLLDPRYWPDTTQLVADYLRFNPTRNRPLDMLPVFAEIDGERVARAVRGDERELVSARPAYHYRLPNCQIDEPGWTLASEWNRWVEVERLSANPERIAFLGERATSKRGG
ncbi:MAG: amidoligase family protein [Myxococcales bacterium]|nr:amidoligase family protein [Myxococcales bacterium]